MCIVITFPMSVQCDRLPPAVMSGLMYNPVFSGDHKHLHMRAASAAFLNITYSWKSAIKILLYIRNRSKLIYVQAWTPANIDVATIDLNTPHSRKHGTYKILMESSMLLAWTRTTNCPNIWKTSILFIDIMFSVLRFLRFIVFTEFNT